MILCSSYFIFCCFARDLINATQTEKYFCFVFFFLSSQTDFKRYNRICWILCKFSIPKFRLFCGNLFLRSDKTNIMMRRFNFILFFSSSYFYEVDIYLVSCDIILWCALLYTFVALLLLCWLLIKFSYEWENFRFILAKKIAAV